MLALGRGEYVAAAASLGASVDHRQLLGGSAEQMDIVVEAHLEALFGAEHFDQAFALASKRAKVGFA